jgi:hypothetical protein
MKLYINGLLPILYMISAEYIHACYDLTFVLLAFTYFKLQK